MKILGMFKERNGKWSSKRVGMFLCLLNGIWLSHTAIESKSLDALTVWLIGLFLAAGFTGPAVIKLMENFKR